MKNLLVLYSLLSTTFIIAQNNFLNTYDLGGDKNQGITIEMQGEQLYVFDTKIGKYYLDYHLFDLQGNKVSTTDFNDRGYFAHLNIREDDNMVIISRSNTDLVIDTLLITKYNINGDSISNKFLPIGLHGYADATPFGFIKTPSHYVMIAQSSRTNPTDTIIGKASLWYLHLDFSVDTIIPISRDDYTFSMGLQLGPDGKVYVFSYATCTENEFCDDYKPSRRFVSIFNNKILEKEIYTEGYNFNDIQIPSVFLVTRDTLIIHGFQKYIRNTEPSLRCIDTNGKLIWEVSDQIEGQERTYKYLEKLSDGNFLALGHIEGEGYSRTAYLQKISKHGQVMWERIIGAHNSYDPDEYGSRGVLWRYVEDSSGYLYVVGLMGGPTSEDMVLMKVDPYGCVDEDRCNKYYVVNPLNGNHKYDQINLMQKEWYYTVTDKLGKQTIQHVTIGQDTILYDTINGNQKYKLLYHNGVKDHYSLRWDVSGKLYRMYDVHRNPWEWLKRDTCIYDFTLKVGDKFSLPAGFKTATVIQVDSINLLDDKSRKRLILRHDNPSNQQKFGNLIWIEGIGSPNGLLYYRDWFNGTSTSLNCYFDRAKKRYGEVQECNSPIHNTIPFITTDKEWVVYYQGFSSNLDDGIRSYSFIETNDTVENVPLYELVYSTPTISNVINTQKKYIEKEGKVARYYDNGDKDLIYDFSVSVGDTIARYPNQPLFNLIVVKVDTITYDDGKSRRRIHLLCELENNTIYTWVEGIGSDSVFLNNAICTIVDGPTLDLRCYFENGVKVYKDPLVEDCLISDVDDITNQVKINIYPNPTIDKIFIKSEIDIKSVSIHNQLRQVMIKVENDLREIDISDLPNGIYNLDIILNDNKNSRIIKRITKM